MYVFSQQIRGYLEYNYLWLMILVSTSIIQITIRITYILVTIKL